MPSRATQTSDGGVPSSCSNPGPGRTSLWKPAGHAAAQSKCTLRVPLRPRLTRCGRRCSKGSLDNCIPLHRVEPPLAWDALQVRDAAIAEPNAGPRDEVLDRARDEHFTRRRFGRHSRSDMHGDPSDLAVHDLALARVEPSANLQPEVSHGVTDRACAPDRARRPVEAGEEAISCRVDLAARKPDQLPPNALVVLLEELPPPPVAKLR